MCFRRNKHLLPHERNGCSHNWVHNAGKQCEWDIWSFEDCKNGIKPEDYIKDSNKIANMYICTMCGEELWSSYKMFDIPHYRVKGVNNNGKRRFYTKL